MMMTKEQEFLKAQSLVQGLQQMVELAIAEGRRIDEVEGELFAGLMQVGKALLGGFVAAQGDGDVGPTVTDDQEQTWRRLPEVNTRRYVSVFGELLISRFVYGTRAGQKIEAVPLDARLGLPASDFSYLLENWVQQLCVKESFQEAGASLATLLGLRLGVRTLETMNQRLADFADAFRDQQPVPETEEALLVVTADGKGVPMRRPLEERVCGHQRRRKGEKAQKKQMAYVGAVYSIARFVRTASDVVEEVCRRERAADRPRPQHKRVRAEMTAVLEGEAIVTGRETLFGELSDEVVRRRRGQTVKLVCLLDGERALWEQRAEYFPWSVGILDLFHVLERLWQVAHAWHGEQSPRAPEMVTDSLRMLLEGKVRQLLARLRRRLKTHPLKGSKRTTVQAAINYMRNQQEHMKYDEYLAAGYPIGSGVVEGACRHLVKDRLEETGMRWTVAGAQAMLDTRAIYLNGDWKAFLQYRIAKEQTRLYGQMAA